MTRFGKSSPDGSAEIEADECILTGRKLEAPFEGTIRQRVYQSPYFYRMLGAHAHLATEDMQALWAAEAKAQDRPASVSVARSGKAKSEGGE